MTHERGAGKDASGNQVNVTVCVVQVASGAFMDS